MPTPSYFLIGSRQIRAIIFDMDGLLLDSESVSQVLWQKASSDVGFTMSDELFQQMVGRDIRENEELVKGVLGQDYPFWEVREARLKMEMEYVVEHGMPVKQGAKRLLEFLQQSNIAFALATSTERKLAEFRLESVSLRKYFSAIVTGDEVENGKPAPDIFLLAAEKIGCSVEHCLVLEDSGAGIEAAQRAGALPIMVPDLKPATPEILSVVEGVYSDLDKVREYLIACMQSL